MPPKRADVDYLRNDALKWHCDNCMRFSLAKYHGQTYWKRNNIDVSTLTDRQVFDSFKQCGCKIKFMRYAHTLRESP
jgi:hypothetical protein